MNQKITRKQQHNRSTLECTQDSSENLFNAVFVLQVKTEAIAMHLIILTFVTKLNKECPRRATEKVTCYSSKGKWSSLRN